jgi:hypothetical protein
MSSEKEVRPGDQFDTDMTIYVKDKNGKTINEIQVPAGHRVPPTNLEDAKYYSTQE